MSTGKTPPAFQFYAQDFLVGTADMTPEEVGAYIRLMAYQWTKGGVPDDLKKIRQMSGLFDPEALKAVLAKFKRSDDGMLRNVRLEATRADQRAYSERQSQIAKDGWKRRKEAEANPLPTHTPEERVGIATAMPEGMPESCSSPSPSTSSSTTTSSSQKVSSENETFSTAPAKVSKPKKTVVVPERDEFIDYAMAIPELAKEPAGWEYTISAKYSAWVAAGWKDGNGKPIQNWKSKLKNTIPYLKPFKNGQSNSKTGRRNIDERMADAAGRSVNDPYQPPVSDSPIGFEEGGDADVVQ